MSHRPCEGTVRGYWAGSYVTAWAMVQSQCLCLWRDDRLWLTVRPLSDSPEGDLLRVLRGRGRPAAVTLASGRETGFSVAIGPVSTATQ